MKELKGIAATIGTAPAVVVAWLPAVEAALRIGVSIVGIIAGIYAARYWHEKRQRLKSDERDNDTP